MLKNILQFIVAVIPFLLPLALAQQTEQRPSKSGKPMQVRAIQVHTFTSPQGRFTVSIPLGWEFKPFAPDESSIGFTPKGKTHPEVTIAFTEASLTAFQMGLQPFGHQWYSQRLSAKDFLQGVFIPLLQQKVHDLKVESLDSQKFPAAQVIVSGTSEDEKKLQGKIICLMDYIQDSTIPPFGGWYNFAYLNMVVASPAEMSAAEPVAAHIFRSFRPTERWMAEVLSEIVQGMSIRGRIIRETITRLNSMEMQQRMSEMQSMTQIGKGWMDTLGGTAEVKNPETGETWRVFDEYKYYFQEGNRVYGTDDYTQLNLLGRHPLQR